jgi:aldehyde dehydrogenase (NAD+)
MGARYLCGERKTGMRKIERTYIGGKLAVPHGTELFDLFNPSQEEVIGQVRLADSEDGRAAIAAAKKAQESHSRTPKAERIDMLRRLHAEIERWQKAIVQASMEEYGAPTTRAETAAHHAAQSFADAATVLESYDFERKAGTADVFMKPIGVAGLITPWNSNAGFICSKVASALAAGCASIVKPSEMSAFQTDVVIEAFHAAGLPHRRIRRGADEYDDTAVDGAPTRNGGGAARVSAIELRLGVTAVAAIDASRR